MAGCASVSPAPEGEVDCPAAVPAREFAAQVFVQIVDDQYRSLAGKAYLSPGIHQLGLVSARNLARHRGAPRVMRWLINVKPGARYTICGVHPDGSAQDFKVLVLKDSTKPDMREPVEVPTLEVLEKSASR